MGRKNIYKVSLSEEDKKLLHKTINDKKSCKTVIRRCQLLLELDENNPNKATHKQLAKSYGMSPSTVAVTARTYAQQGISSVVKIKRNPRCNARKKVDGRTEAEILRIACGPAPEGYDRWSLRLLEKQVKLELEEPVGREAIRLALKKMNFTLT